MLSKYSAVFRALAIFLLLILSETHAQDFALGSWREHLPYLKGNKVALAGDQVYCATDDGFFSYRKNDQQLVRYSKLNGLNDFGVSQIAYCSALKVLVVVYSNTNIDLIYDDGLIVNMSDIKRKNIPGNKVVNSIYINGETAYLACGFGIVVLNLSKREVADTYYLTASASPDILAVVSDNNYLYAACNNGVYQAALTSPQISNYTAWNMILADSSGTGDYNAIVSFNNLILVNCTRGSSDTLLAWNGSWGVSLPAFLQSASTKYSVRADNSYMYITEFYGFNVLDASLSRIRYIDATQVAAPNFRDGIVDGNGEAWIAERSRGLVHVMADNLTTEKLLPDGPNSPRNAAMQVVDGTLWTVHGPKSRGWLNAYRYDGFSRFDGSDWLTYDGYTPGDTIFSTYNFFDNMSLVVDPSDKNHLFVGSGGAGMLNFSNGKVIAHYDTANSTLLAQTGNVTQFKVHGMQLDNDRNLWVTNAGTPGVIQVLKNNGSWKRFLFPGAVNSSAKSGELIIDNNGYVWVILFENVSGKDGILVFDPNFTIDNTADDGYELIDFSSNRVRCMSKDKDGTIWVGTEGGIYVFYPPSLKPQQILIKQNNAYQYLLASEVVTAICIDAANRKWVGTESGGLYLFSADGQEQIQHFTVSNSPLFSNNITALAIDGKSGEVYIGTEKGLMSYRGDAIEPAEGSLACEDLLVYPNPVRSEYNGPIAIKGLVPNGNVRITDVNGGLVFITKSLGTQAVWDGRRLNGERVASGVYLVFSSDETGENTCTTKVMIFR